ncbi:hypothetical protein [Gordonia caeni]|uniref:Uncharacterized protein n=2 Tax=Actinomycetes TaxID=1760 RepID=A0ABP7P2N5_9ACTN
MLRVYLDQFSWIGLARAAHGRTGGERYRDALEMCRAARVHEMASFPLDLYRYWETAKNHNEGSRNRLVETMIELSDFDTITTPKQLLYYEIDIALRARFGRPTDVTAPRVFGRGIAHLTAGGVHNSMRPTDEWATSGDKSSDLRTPVDRQLEELLLRAGPSTHAHAGLPLDLVNWGDLFVQHEVSVAEEIARRKVPRAELLPAVVHSDFNDIAPALRDRLTAAGISATEVTETLGGVGLLQLVQSLPTRRVTNALRVSKHLHPPQHQKWKSNDFIDAVQLPVRTVYCDLVFTEQQWVRALTRDKDDKLDERFDTKLIFKPEQLVEALVTASP